ncbi:hypothetical protein [Mesorhizobium sp. ANAO-SY3R2]|uniref:hypothetical protein n=1 Tax=Mesorhizobium sp. ANAO-SY3R2 TaxID=3166644 RepID=UPI003672D39F
MKYQLALASAALAFACSVTAHAADAVSQEVLEPVAAESRIKGAFEIGGWANHYNQTDYPRSDTDYGIYGSAFAHIDVGSGFFVGLDAQGEYLRIDEPDDFRNYQPSNAGVVGASLNYRSGAVALGVFGGVGGTNNERHENKNGTPYVAGAQASFDFGSATVFGQIGRADIRVNEEDSGFTGTFGKLGMIYGVSENFALALDGGYGRAPKDYEDEDDSGKYWTVGLKGALKLTDTMPLFGTAGYEYRKFEANTEDSAFEHSFRLGVSYAFGGATTAKDTFNPFQTPITPFRAAAYGEVLD